MKIISHVSAKKDKKKRLKGDDDEVMLNVLGCQMTY